MSTFLGLMLLLLAATTSPVLENNLSDGTDVLRVPGTTNTSHELRNQVSILHEEVSVSVVSIIVVSYRPSLITTFQLRM